MAMLLVLTLLATGTGDARPAYVTYESDRGPMLLGVVERADILEHFPDWPEELEGWQPDSTAVAHLAELDAPVLVRCVLGTWCEDSRREVPRFWRIMDALPDSVPLALEMVAVGRADDRKATEKLAELGLGDDYRSTHDVTAVPTFVFLDHQGRELGRIVETPDAGLAVDTVRVLEQCGVLRQASGGGGMHFRRE